MLLCWTAVSMETSKYCKPLSPNVILISSNSSFVLIRSPRVRLNENKESFISSLTPFIVILTAGFNSRSAVLVPYNDFLFWRVIRDCSQWITIPEPFNLGAAGMSLFVVSLG